jgi:hypothetical protein
VDEKLACYRVWSDKSGVRIKRKIDELVGMRKVFDDAIQPAFEKRGWATGIIEANKRNIACGHVGCLDWDVFTAQEKISIEKELRKLSNSNRVSMYILGSKLGFSWLFDLKSKLFHSLKSVVKRVI